MKKAIYIFILFVFFASLSNAQITLTQATATTVYAVGNTMYSHEDTLLTTLNIGSTGNTSWDFSGISAHVSIENTSVAPATSPWISEFPTANMCLKTLQPSFSGIPADFYTYVNVTSTEFSVLGSKMEFTMQGFVMQTKLTNNPPENSLIFPLTYGTEWTTVHNFTAASFMGGVPVNTSTEAVTTYHKCDAYGTAIMPDGQVFQALRIKHDERSYEAADNYYKRDINYEVVASNGMSVSFTAADTLAPDNGVIDVIDVLWFAPGTVDVKPENQPIPTDFTLFQNYPNPFNPSTTIKFSIPSESFVNLTIYDALGKEITTLVNEELPAGTYNATWDASSSNHSLAAGVYFYQLKANNFSQTKKLLFVK